MKGGGGKRKGNAFERIICKHLSLWITNGDREDCLWRSAMSGGRATIAYTRNGEPVRQGGDIASVSPEGHALVDRFTIECKCVRSLELVNFMLHNIGRTARFWSKLVMEAQRDGKQPMLIAKENRGAIIVIAKTLSHYAEPYVTIHERGCSLYLFSEIISSNFDLSTKGTS